MNKLWILLLSVVICGCTRITNREEPAHVSIKDLNRVEFAESLIAVPGRAANDILYYDQENVIWVDWGEDDVSIVKLTERVLETGSLSAALVSDSNELMIRYDEADYMFPLIMDGTTQHITLMRLNEVLEPRYQLRMAWDSYGSDTAAIIPLSLTQWKELDVKYGEENVAHSFLKLAMFPNIFTDQLIRP